MIRTSKISPAFTGLFALCAALTATPVLAVDGGCAQWDVSGDWRAVQSNIVEVGSNPTMHLQQTGTRFQGSAHYYYYVTDDGLLLVDGLTRRYDVDGPIVGSVTGSSFEATVYWNNNTIGVYTGQVGPQGLVVGSTYDKNNPGTRADWHSDHVAHCQPGTVIPPPMALGRVAPPHEVAFARVHTDEGTPSPPICDSARSAKARNSPAAPGLERQCLASGGSVTQPPPPAPMTGVMPPPQIAPATLDDLAAVGAAIAAQDPEVAEARNADPSAFYQIGFDIASGIFGDPALGAKGNTLMGPGSEKIRGSLSAAGQRGFNASVAFHLARDYKH